MKFNFDIFEILLMAFLLDFRERTFAAFTAQTLKLSDLTSCELIEASTESQLINNSH